MTKDPLMYIEDIVESVHRIDEYLHGVSEETFSQDEELQDAVLRRLSIIGEAASRIPEHIKNRYLSIPWPTIIGFRNVIIHDYSGVSMGVVWQITQSDLPNLKKELETFTEMLKKESSR